MLKGQVSVKLDGLGRICMPNEFLSYIRANYGSQLFAMSPDDKSILLYPLPIWLEIYEQAKDRLRR